MQKGRCPKARPSWNQGLGQKHPLAHMPVFQSAAVAGTMVVFLVEQSAGKLVAGIEDQVLGGQPELDLDCHADLELADG